MCGSPSPRRLEYLPALGGVHTELPAILMATTVRGSIQGGAEDQPGGSGAEAPGVDKSPPHVPRLPGQAGGEVEPVPARRGSPLFRSFTAHLLTPSRRSSTSAGEVAATNTWLTGRDAFQRGGLGFPAGKSWPEACSGLSAWTTPTSLVGRQEAPIEQKVML